jgi:hypothetical protein
MTTGGTTMQTVSELVAHASAVGLVTRREVEAGVVTVRSADAPHVRTILVQDHPVGYVKEPAPRQPWVPDDLLNRERCALTWLPDHDLGPRLLGDQPADALWVTVLRGRSLPELDATITELAEVCDAWGLAVATLHQLSTSRPGVPQAPRPWLLDPDRRARALSRAPRESGQRAVLTAVEDDPGLRAACRLLSARWSDRHWVHGSISAPNVRVEVGPPVRVRFANFENAGLGDPAWDLASAVDTITGLAPSWRTPAEPLVDYLLRGYRRGGGPAILHPAVQAVTALATAWQLPAADPRSGASAAEQTAGFWLRRARGFAGRTTQLT